MGPNLRDVAQQVQQEERRKVRLAKIEEIAKAWDDLFFVLAGEEVFKKSKSPEDYSSFENSMSQALKEARLLHIPDDPLNYSPPANLLNQLGELLSVDYIPPKNGEKMAIDLIHLREYYLSGFFFPSVETTLDLSLCKLIRATCRLHREARERGINTLSPTKARKNKVISKKTAVLRAFYSENKKSFKGKSFDWVANKIKKNLVSRNETANSEDKIKIPSERTIKRYLEQDEKASKDLIAMEVIKDRTDSIKKT